MAPLPKIVARILSIGSIGLQTNFFFLCSLSKILQGNVQKRAFYFVENSNITPPHPFCFRPRHSIFPQVQQITENWMICKRTRSRCGQVGRRPSLRYSHVMGYCSNLKNMDSLSTYKLFWNHSEYNSTECTRYWIQTEHLIFPLQYIGIKNVKTCVLTMKN